MPRMCLIFLCLITGVAAAGVLRTNSGKVLEGEIRVENGSLSVKSPGGVEAIPFHDVLYLDLRPGRVGRAPVEHDDPKWRDLSKWTASNIGLDRDPPQINANAKLVRFDAAGLDIGPKETLKKDQFVFLHRPLIGDGVITARVEDYAANDSEAPRCGVMFREDLWTDAPYVMISVTGSSVYLQHRAARGQESRREAKADRQQRFMRLARTGHRFVASVSSDGDEWREIGALEMQFKSDALVGLAAASRKKDSTRAVAFSSTQVRHGEAKAASPWSERRVERGFLLRDGTVFRGEFHAFDQSTVRFSRPNSQQQSLPQADVARVIFRNPKSASDEPRGEGILLSNGQFVAGQIKSIEGGTLTLSSVLFGIKRYSGHEIAHAVLREPGASAAAWEIESRDGSRFAGNDLRLMKDGVHFTSPLLGQIKLQWYELAQVRPGGGRAVALSSLRIDRVAEGDSFALDALPGELPLGIGGAEPIRAVGAIGKASLVWDLAGKYSMFAVDCAVPDSASSDAPVRFVILGDGKELYRSDSMTRRTPAASLSIDVSGVKSLTLRTESDGIAALWAEPYLIKAP